MTRLLVVCCFSLLLAGVSGADVTVKVVKGDDVTLLIHPEEIKAENKAEKFLWTHNKTQIATIDFEENSLLFPDDRFRGRLKLDSDNGSLTINYITTDDTGEYKLEIKSSGIPIYKTFSVTVNDQAYTSSVIKGDAVTLPSGVKIQSQDVKCTFNGIITCLIDSLTGELSIRNINTSGEYEVGINASDFILRKRFCVNVSEEESVSRKEEEFVILQTNSPTQSDDVIEWKFKNTSIALFNRTANTYSYPDAKKKDRVQVESSGSLTIQQLKTEDSGDYDVNINNSNRFIHKRFSLTVIEPDSLKLYYGLCIGLAIGLAIGLVIGITLTVIYFVNKSKKK